MQKHALLIFGLIITLGLGLFIALWLYTPSAVTSKLESAIQRSGFQDIALPTPQKQFGKLTYQNISLDADDFSRLESLEIHYGPFSLFSMRAAQKIKITGLDLTGELNDNLDITIAGFSQSPVSKGLQPITNLAHEIEIEDAKLSLLSQKLGGISLSGDIQILPSRSHSDIRGRISAAQKQLSANIVLNGRIPKKGDMTIESEIESAKFDFEDIRATRVAGKLRLEGRHLSDMALLGELEAGSLNINDKPWANAAITLDNTLTQPRILIGAKSAGVEGLELSLSKHLNDTKNVQMEIHIQDLRSAASYLDVHNILKLEQDALKNLPDIQNLFVQIDKNDKNESALLSLKDGEIKINGNIKTQGEIKTIEFDSPPFDIKKLLPQSKIEGQARISGELKTSKTGNVQGTPKLKLQNAQIPYGPITTTIPEAEFIITDIATLSTTDYQKTPCNITDLHQEIECALNAKFENAKLSIKNLSLGGPGLNLEIGRAQKTNDKTLLFDLQRLDISEIARLFGNDQWQGYGKLKGQILTRSDDTTMAVQNITIQNDGAGILKITDPKFFNQINVEDLEKETLKMALENFHFEKLEITGHGAFPDGIQIKIEGKGKNPDMMQGRSFSFDFDLTPNLMPIFSRLSE